MKGLLASARRGCVLLWGGAVAPNMGGFQVGFDGFRFGLDCFLGGQPPPQYKKDSTSGHMCLRIGGTSKMEMCLFPDKNATPKIIPSGKTHTRKQKAKQTDTPNAA